MIEPPKISSPPVTVDPTTGEPTMTGADALPWAIDTLDMTREIRAKFVRLQNWVKSLNTKK